MEWSVDSNLKIGDFVFLKHVKPIEGFLGTDGLSSDDVILTKEVEEYEHCLWQIHVQNQYSAMREYEDFYYMHILEQQHQSAGFDGDHTVEDDLYEDSETNGMLNQLKRAAANENTLNKKLMAMKLGKTLQFGDVFQLCHVQTKKMLTINSTVLAKHERENIRISLHPHGDALSWFEFIPRSKSDREGQHISNNAEAFIRVHERPSEYIHAARKPLRENENFREINCSLETSCWNVCIFQEGSSLLSSNISAGQLISFQEPETSTYLTLEEGSDALNRHGDKNSDNRLVMSTSTPMTVMPSGDCTVGTQMLWQVDKENRQMGGYISNRSDKVTLRHLNSGRYLHLESDSLTTVSDRKFASFFEISTSAASDNKSLIQNNSIVHLSENGKWMQLPSTLLSRMVTNTRVSLNVEEEIESPRRLSAIQLQSVASAPYFTDKGFTVSDKTNATSLRIGSNLYKAIGVDLYFGVRSSRFLKKFVRSIKRGTLMNKSVSNVETFVKTLFSVLQNILDFLTDHLSNYGNEDNVVFSFDDVAEGDRKTVAFKQTMMREQGVLTQILNIIELCGDGELENLPDSVRRRRRRAGKQGHASGTLKSPSSRQLIRATSTFKTLVGQLSEDKGTPAKDRSMKSITKKVAQSRGFITKQDSRGGLGRQASVNRSLSRQGSSEYKSDSHDNIARRNSLQGLRSIQEYSGDRKKFLEKSRSRKFQSNQTFSGSESFDPNSPLTPMDSYNNNEDLQNLVQGLRTISHDISAMCFRALLAIIQDNHLNQMFIADQFPIILHQMKDQALAVLCVQEMLHDNLQMLQTKVREREIDIFLELLEESEMNVTLLNLLRSTCSCPMGVDSTQRMISKALLGSKIDNIPEESKDSLSDDSVPLLLLPSNKQYSVMKVEHWTSDPGPKERPLFDAFSGGKGALLIRVSMSPTAKERGVTWTNKIIYMPDDETMCSSVMGYDLIHDGIPRLTVNWDCRGDHTLSMLHLFGFSKDVPYEYLCNISKYDAMRSKKRKDALISSTLPDAVAEAAGTGISLSEPDVLQASTRKITSAASSRKVASSGRKKTKRSTINGKNRLSVNTMQKMGEPTVARKVQVADYFCAQLYLMADLCLDRNYVAMKYVEESFPYDMLITMLKTPNSSQRFKAPVCRLIKCLYVDREPQTEAKFPRLIRTSVSLSGGEENSFEDHHEGSPFKFSILQEIISDYIHNELDTTHCDELSAEMMELLLSLIKFGFYTTVSQLQDVVAPLTKALGEHRNINNKKTLPWKSTGKYDTTSDEENGSSSIDRRGVPVNLKASDLKNIQAPSLAQALFGFAQPSPTTTGGGDENESVGITSGFWESFRKLGKSSVLPDADTIEEGNQQSSLSTRLTGLWSKLSAPIPFMKPSSDNAPPSPTKSPRVQSMRDLKNTKGKSARNLFVSEESCTTMDVDSKMEPSQKVSVNGNRREVIWEEVVLQFTESLYFVAGFVFLVVASTTLVVIQLSDLSFYDHKEQVIVDLSFTATFLVEVLIRMYCTYMVHNEVLSFFTNPLKFMDVFIVLLDIFVVAMDFLLGGKPNYVNAAKFLRVLRMFRIIRVFRAARLINSIAKNSYRHQQYVIPERYSTTTEYEVRTITGIIQVISAVHDRLQDRKLGFCIQYFSDWFNDSLMMNKTSDPKDVYTQLNADTGLTNAFPPKFDAMLVDVVMYNDPKLTDQALQLLMVHESQEELFLSTAKQVQIIYSSKLERLYRSVVSDLRQLKTLSESYELWAASVEDGSDMEAADKMVEILQNIHAHLTTKIEATKLECGQSSRCEREVQQLLFNLDAMSVFMGIEHSLLDGQLDEPKDAIKNIIRLCNETIISFVTENEENQNLAFEYFNWFLERIDDGLGSSRVAKSIIAGNRNLMKQCPKNLLSDFIKNIVTHGRKPEYLDLIIGMTEIVDDGDSGVISLRNEISRSVTSRDRVRFLIEWCDGPGTVGYEERKLAMAPFLDKSMPVSNLDLPVRLQYHVNLLTLLSGLKLGQKLQAVYAIEDIIAAIIDENTLYNVQKCLSLLLEEMVQNKIDGLDSSECIWEYFMHCERLFDTILSSIPSYLSREQYHLRFQHAEWINRTLRVIISFFDNFDFLVFRETAFDSESAFKVTSLRESDIQLVIFNLHHSIKSIRSTHKHRLGETLLSTFDEALLSLSHLIVQVNTEEDTNTAPQGRRASLMGSRGRGLDAQGRAGRADEIHEAYYRKQYLMFLDELTGHYDNYNLHALKIFEKLPSVKDSVDSDVRLEYFIVKISSHIRSKISTSGSARNLEGGAITAAKWVLDTWTHLVQKELGQIALDDLVDPQRIVDLPYFTHFQEILNNCGATVLCLDMIAINMNPSLINGAMKLLIVLLSGRGGNPMVQQAIFEYLVATDSVLFFEQMKELLDQQMVWCQRKAEMKSESSDVVLPDSFLSLKLLSAICDNNFMSNKNVLREQRGNSRFVNLLDSMAIYVDLLSRLEDHTCVKICSRVVHAILSFVQGPCKGNQEHFVLHTNLLSALNRIMRLSQSSIQVRPKDWSNDIEILKEYAFELLHACIEGQRAGSVVLERVHVAMELNVLNVLIVPSELDEFGDVIELSDMTDLQATYLVFLQNLSNNCDNIEIPLNVKSRIESDVAHIQIMWNREVHTHYFSIPSIAKDITGAAKSRLVESVDLTSQETKLKDFLRRAKDMHGEAVHHQNLKDLGIVDIWNMRHKLSWLMLANALLMNILMVSYYQTDSNDNIDLPSNVSGALFALNSFHIVFSICVLSTYLIVRVPVLYWSHLGNNYSVLVSIILAVTDPMPLWYSIYLCVSLVSILENYLFLSVLLLDFIVMDSTSRDVMNAVIYPARQLATALIIIMIMVNIFSGAVFYFFRHDFDFDDVDGNNLFNTIKLLITFGVRANEGVGAYMTPNIQGRFVLDMFFFLIIVVILMNIFFGIIIDTFGKLRNLKVEREADESSKCFICGVEEHYFLKHSSSIADGNANEGFKFHRRVTHNMWNYLYFVMKIWQQPRDLDNSVEMHVRSCMERGDISWFPIGIFNADSPSTDAEGSAIMSPKLKEVNKGELTDNVSPSDFNHGIDGNNANGGSSSGKGIPSRRNSAINFPDISKDLSRLEETVNNKMSELTENMATLMSTCSAQNTLEDNALDEAEPRRSLRNSVYNIISESKASSTSKIAEVTEQVRNAVALASIKRLEAQRALATLEEESMKSGEEQSSEDVLAPTEQTSGAPRGASQSAEMMQMIRQCLQEEFSPLRVALDRLTERVESLEQRAPEAEDPPSLVQCLEVPQDSSTATQRVPFDNDDDGNDNNQVLASSKLPPLENPSSETKKTPSRAKGLQEEINRLKKRESQRGRLSSQEQRKLDTTTKLKQAYLDTSKPRVKSAPLAHVRASSPSAAPSTSPKLTHDLSPREQARRKRVQEAAEDFARLKEDEVLDVEETGP